jgi:hypothetical protein
MATPAKGSQITSFALSTTSYTAIIAPIACNYWWIQNSDGSSMLRSSDGTDATSYQVSGFAMVAPVRPPQGPRYQPGDIVTYLKATTGVGPAIVEFIL